ncbi:hypothetical protein [Methanoregula sp. UBA64]|jgi:hypothetical protein|uniref:hypothetical protein n=1 Tax=Methanoregula sp. UBA64 TaxID=1915554 RepID=UPI0025FA434A|nr:hypothetical protein [Methanoregula sp. UBA64]
MSGEESNLQKALTEKEKIERLLENLENLKVKGLVSAEDYIRIKAGYDKLIYDANEAIIQIKETIGKQIKLEDTNINLFTQILENQEIRFKKGELIKAEFKKERKNVQEELQKSEKNKSTLQRLVNANNVSDLSAETVKSRTGSFKQDLLSSDSNTISSKKKTFVVIGGFIVIITLILGGVFFLWQGQWVNEVSQPGETQGIDATGTPAYVVTQSLQLLSNGQYDRVTNLFVDTYTEQPLSEEKKASTIVSLEQNLKQNNFKIIDIQILQTSKINDNRYLVSGTYSYSSRDSFGVTAHNTRNFSYTVIKMNGQWRIVYPERGWW